MRKKTFLLLVISVFMISGCSLGKNKTLKYQEIMEEYSRDFYESYQKVFTLDESVVDISLLKKAVENKDADYDMEKLKACKDESKVIFTINKDKQKIEKVEFDMDCKK